MPQQDNPNADAGAPRSTTTRAKEGAQHALETTRDAARRTAQGLDGNPLAIVAGGLALGAVAGALLPRTTREQQLLKPVGARLAGMAAVAVAAAKEAGMAELEQRGLTRDAAREQAKGMFEGVTQAVSKAGSAAASKAGSTQA